MKRFTAISIALVVVATACLGGGDDVTWDLSEPVTGTDLGALSPTLIEADGPGPVTVRFPSGRTVEFEGFDVAQVALAGSSGSVEYLDQVRVGSILGDGIEELEAFTTEFIDEWGPAVDDDGISLDEFVDDVGPDVAPRSEFVFVGDLQDGILPTLEISKGQEQFSSIARFDFEP